MLMQIMKYYWKSNSKYSLSLYDFYTSYLIILADINRKSTFSEGESCGKMYEVVIYEGDKEIAHFLSSING